MKNGVIFEIAIANTIAQELEHKGFHTTPGDHYWRLLWVEGGEIVDEDRLFGTLAEMACDAKKLMRTGEQVAWRYYETGVCDAYPA